MYITKLAFFHQAWKLLPLSAQFARYYLHYCDFDLLLEQLGNVSILTFFHIDGRSLPVVVMFEISYFWIDDISNFWTTPRLFDLCDLT
ncbi:hypothetical protein HCG51_05710 [Tolypothrix sp. PCC 7910]|uniref:hypothetical protein n=1 Tax=Tolypothrix sp. PCC 7910 TaxID=2099387 RepID=UPI001427899E|nr:hypothetical protein [Tolypothrix sp. PCC 7910]QIR35265.1 hypothetical protein HCG51_05710 [Tolypothrix sp. PCC 7910]